MAAWRVFSARTGQCLWSMGSPPTASSTSCAVNRPASSNVLPAASRAAMAPLRMEALQPSVVKFACKIRSFSTQSQNSIVSPQGPRTRALALAPLSGPKLAGSSRTAILGLPGVSPLRVFMVTSLGSEGVRRFFEILSAISHSRMQAAGQPGPPPAPLHPVWHTPPSCAAAGHNEFRTIQPPSPIGGDHRLDFPANLRQDLNPRALDRDLEPCDMPPQISRLIPNSRKPLTMPSGCLSKSTTSRRSTSAASLRRTTSNRAATSNTGDTRPWQLGTAISTPPLTRLSCQPWITC